VLHLTALAGRLGIKLTLDDFEENCADIPLLANIVPNGEFLVEEFFRAGGVPAIMSAMPGRIHLDALTVSGRSVGHNIAAKELTDTRVIASIERPINPENALRMHGSIRRTSPSTRARYSCSRDRSAWLSGYARARQHPHPSQAPAARRDRHGAHLGRAHERDCLRHGRAACQPRIGGRRALGSGADR
jgi:Dehydratase family